MNVLSIVAFLDLIGVVLKYSILGLKQEKNQTGVHWRNVKKNGCCKNCAHFGWEMVSGIESIPNPFVNVCLIKHKRKSERGWCNYWIDKKAGALYIKTDKGYEKLCEANEL